MIRGLTGWHLLIILAVVLLLFGATKLPALARSVGQSLRIFKSEVDELKKSNDSGEAQNSVPAEAPNSRTTP